MNNDIIVSRRIARIALNCKLSITAIEISGAIQDLNRTQRFIVRQAKVFTLYAGIKSYIDNEETTSLGASLVSKILRIIHENKNADNSNKSKQINDNKNKQGFIP